jgi:protein SCO1
MARVYKNYAIYSLAFLLFFVSSCTRDSNQDSYSKIFSNLPDIKKVPSFTGKLDNGRTFSDKDIQGSITIVSFFFASCSDICPRMNTILADIVTRHTSKKLSFVSITVDPENDTIQALEKYRKKNIYNDNRWKFLRIEKDSLLTLTINGFLVGSSDNPANHSARFILLDDKSQIRAYYDPFDKEKLRELENLLSEISKK